MKTNQHKARILIADDEASVREILSRRLTEESYKCIVATDGNNALRKLSSFQFDLALLDITMPGKSGIEVLREIKVKYPDTAVIMITAIAEAETAIKAMKAGAYDYIIKPVDLDTLIVNIDRVLDKRRLLLENKRYQLHLEEMVEEQTKKIRDSFLNSIKSLAYALEAKDKYTSGHSQRVTEIAVAIAQELGMPQEKVEKIQLAGLVHDVGKIGVKESVLNKACGLTNDEFDHVKSHCEIGKQILLPIMEDSEILEIVLHHHEHYDGRGYPDGLSAEQIPQGARVLAVADAYANITSNKSTKEELSQGARILAVSDAYDAMTSDRPYRAAMSPEAACAELESCKGTQFDPVIVDTFLRIMTTAAVSSER